MDILCIYLWYVNELHYISSSGAPDLRLQSLADVPQLDALDETWVEALHSSSLLIGKTIDAFDKHWYVHDMFISLFPRFCFPHVIPFQFFCCSSHVFFLNTSFSPLFFSLLTKQQILHHVLFLEVVPQLFRTVVHKQAQTLQSRYFGRKIWEDGESPDVMFRCQQCHRS